MTDPQVRQCLGKPAITEVRRAGGPAIKLTGNLKAIGDGTYCIDSGLGTLENRAHIHMFTAIEIVKIDLL